MPGEVAVIGGGVIGLSVARRAALDGWTVCVHRADDPGASWVAGGMLAPHSEGWPGEEQQLRLGLASLALWHGSYLDGLPSREKDTVVTARESLVVAVDRADAADLGIDADVTFTARTVALEGGGVNNILPRGDIVTGVKRGDDVIEHRHAAE